MNKKYNRGVKLKLISKYKHRVFEFNNLAPKYAINYLVICILESILISNLVTEYNPEESLKNIRFK